MSISEIFDFLSDERLDVRQMALELLAGCSTNRENDDLFESKLTELMETIGDDPTVAHYALKALINLSVNLKLAQGMATQEFVSQLLLCIMLPKNVNADLACMLLNNLSKGETSALLLPPHSHSLTPPNSPGRTHPVDNLLEVFSRGESKTYNTSASFHFLSGVFANLSATPQGCEFFLGKSTIDHSLRLSKMGDYIEHPDLIRRGGTISTFKNVCYGVSLAQSKGLDVLFSEELKLLVHLLLPLSGPEDYTDEEMEGMPEELQLLEPSKKREPDSKLRLMLVECLLLMTGTRESREILRNAQVYPVIQKLHLQEPIDEVSEMIERLVNMLMCDEETLPSSDSPSTSPSKEQLQVDMLV